MQVGYIRISTAGQNTARQEVLMRELGVEKVFIDRLSGKNTDRPELKKMMAFVRQGDTVVVESISRFARNTRDLLELVEQLTKKGVEFVSKKEAIDTTMMGVGIIWWAVVSSNKDKAKDTLISTDRMYKKLWDNLNLACAAEAKLKHAIEMYEYVKEYENQGRASNGSKHGRYER